MTLTSSSVLVVGPDVAIVAVLRRALTSTGWYVVHAADGRKVPARCELDPPALVLLDLHRLGSDGVELVRQIHERVTLPIVALGTAADRQLLLAALDAGADDCLTLPCGPDEVVMRVQTVLRRNQAQTRATSARRIHCGSVEIDPQSLQVWRDGQELSLRAKERALLAVFLAHPGQLLTHQFLLQQVWGDQYHDETNYLHIQINALRRKLEDQPSQPVYLLTERGIGYRLALPPTPPERSAALPAATAAPPSGPTLLTPPVLTRPPGGQALVGRSVELAELQVRVCRDHLAVITGMPGVGKTALAAVLAQTVAAAPQQIFWHPCYTGQGIDALIWHFAGFLAHHGQDAVWQLLQHAHQNGTAPPPADVLLTYLLQLATGQSLVLCFDDVQFVDTDPLLTAFAARLLEQVQAGELTLILVSQRLPIWVPASSGMALAGLMVEGSTELLQQRGIALPDNLLRALHAQTEGNPQLLVLAGAVLHDTPDPATVLSHLPHTIPIEHFLLTRIDIRLSDAERQVMRVIAVLLGFPATSDEIAAISDLQDATRILQTLHTRALLMASNAVPSRTYTQHALVRAFYYHQLDRRERERLHRRAAQYYSQEQPDLLAATRHFQAAGDSAQAIAGVTDQVRDIINQGQAHALAQLLSEVSIGALDVEAVVTLSLAQAELAAWLGDGPAAQAHYSAALNQLAGMALSPTVREQRARACYGMGELLEHEAPQQALEWLQRGLLELGGAAPQQEAALSIKLSTVYITLSDYAAARLAVEQGMQLLSPDPSPLRMRALINLGVIACAEGDIVQGNTHTLHALELSQQFHDSWAMIQCWLNLGVEIEIAGDWAAAEVHYQQALQLALRLGNTKYQVALVCNLGILKTNQGDFGAAERYLQQGLALAQDGQVAAWAVAGQASLADLYVRAGAYEQAARVLERAEVQAQAVGATDQLPEIARSWALIRLAEGDVEVAAEQAIRAVALAEIQAQPIGLGVSLRVLGQVLTAQGQTAAARETFARSLALLAERDPYEAARTRMQWGRLLVAELDPATGTQLLAEARATFERLGARHDLALLGSFLGTPAEDVTRSVG